MGEDGMTAIDLCTSLVKSSYPKLQSRYREQTQVEADQAARPEVVNASIKDYVLHGLHAVRKQGAA
jgi:hypothetical protein